jgi:hypothetical protein
VHTCGRHDERPHQPRRADAALRAHAAYDRNPAQGRTRWFSDKLEESRHDGGRGQGQRLHVQREGESDRCRRKGEGWQGAGKEGTYADFEKALKVGKKLTCEAKDGVLTEVKITGMGKGKGKAKDGRERHTPLNTPFVPGVLPFLPAQRTGGA